MRAAYEWTEADLQALIAEQRPEDLLLEYKAADALGKHDRKKIEITKDVSAMANSAGGTLLYGIDEQKSRGGPIRIEGVDPSDISSEWLEQVIDSGIQRHIPGLIVSRIDLSSVSRKVIYIVSVPQSNIAPHMAADHRFYKRLGTTTAFMEEYEIRDVGRRSEAPDLHLTIQATFTSYALDLLPAITNSSAEPALYATLRLFVPLEWKLASGDPNWQLIGHERLGWNHSPIDLHVLRRTWVVPHDPPLIEGESHSCGSCRFGPQSVETISQVGWEIRSPRMISKMRPVLIYRRSSSQVEEQVFSLLRSTPAGDH